MKMLFVFNPNSGKVQIKNQLMKIIQVFSKAGYEITVYPTKAPLDGYQHIIDNEGKYDVIACSGGDGTLNETVAAILKYKGEKPPIGYIPSGTTNDFAASLGIPRNMVKAAVNIVKGKRFPCDVGMVMVSVHLIMSLHLAHLQGFPTELHRILRMYSDIRLM